MNAPAERRGGPEPTAAAEAPSIPAAGLQLHLGSGPHAEPGWINVDKSWVARISRAPIAVHALARLGVLSDQQRTTRWPREVVHMDLTRRFPWEDRSARAIYSSHMVEHLDRAEARKLLHECLRVLKTDGILRLALPNLLGAAEHYLEVKAAGDQRAADRFVEFLYLVPQYESMSRLRQLAVRLFHRPHAWMYDCDSMKWLLEDIGFVNVTDRSFREGRCPSLATLETRADGPFEASTFFVEAVKP